MDRKREKGLVLLAESIVTHAGRFDLTIEIIAKHFGATSAVFWKRTEHTMREFTAEGVYNRPDFQCFYDQNDVPHFHLSEENVIFRSDYDTRNVIVGRIGEEPFDEAWLSKAYTNGLREQNIREVAVCPIEDEEGDPFGAVSLYFADPISDRSTFREQFGWTCHLFYAVINSITERIKAIGIEQSKLGHEIEAQVSNLQKIYAKIEAQVGLHLSVLERGDWVSEDNPELARRIKAYDSQSRKFLRQLDHQIDADLPRGRAATLLNDARQPLEIISELADERSFRISIENQKKHAVYIDPFVHFQDAAQPIIQRVKKSTVRMGPLQREERHVELLIAPSHFSIIVTNFISNAVKYSRKQSRIQPALNYSGRTGTLALEVTNRSGGIPEDEQEKIWRAHYRSRHALRGDQSGHGMGLNVVRDICEAYGLEYGYDERPANEEGDFLSTFWVEFPRKLIRNY